MSALEIVGFIIAFIVFLFLKSTSHVGQKRGVQVELPPEYHEDREDPLVKLLAALDQKSPKEKKREGEGPRPLPAHKTEQQRSLEHGYKQRRTSPSIESSTQQHRPSPRPVKHQLSPVLADYEERYNRTANQTHPSRARELIRTLPHKQNLVIYQEIMGKPKSLRTEEWP
jgi:hypothetical protein